MPPRSRAQKGQTPLIADHTDDQPDRPGRRSVPSVAELRRHLEAAGLPAQRSGKHFIQGMPAQAFGRFLKAEREAKGWSQEELGRRSGLRQTQISAYELEHVTLPSKENLYRLDTALGLAPGTLMARAGWQGAKEKVEKHVPAGALVVPEPTPELHALVEVVGELPPAQVARLVTLARTMIEHPGEQTTTRHTPGGSSQQEGGPSTASGTTGDGVGPDTNMPDVLAI